MNIQKVENGWIVSVRDKPQCIGKQYVAANIEELAKLVANLANDMLKESE